MRRFPAVLAWAWSGALLLVAMAGTVRARTITVAKDGSAEFSVVQDALDAAAPGDSILIGPGRYPELHTVQSPLDFFEDAARPTVSGITIVGAGAGQTILGPAVPTDNIAGRQTVGLAIEAGVTGLRVTGLTIENLRFLVSTEEALEMSDCQLLEPTLHAVSLFGCDGTTFRRCLFHGTTTPGADGIISYVGQSNARTTIEDCEFSGQLGAGVLLEGAASTNIRRSSFQGMLVGIQLTGGAPASISECDFGSIEFYDVVLWQGCDTELGHCRLGSTQIATMLVQNSSKLRGTRNVLHGSQTSTLWLAGGVDVALDSCDVLNNGGLSVFVESSAQYVPQVDLRHNFWGTSDLAQIAAWVRDGNDPPPQHCWYCPAAVVTYEPILGGTVPTEESTFGGLKARYGGGNQ